MNHVVEIGADCFEHDFEGLQDLSGCVWISGPANCLVAGSTPAVPPIETLAIWLCGPTGVGVFGGVNVSPREFIIGLYERRLR